MSHEQKHIQSDWGCTPGMPGWNWTGGQIFSSEASVGLITLLDWKGQILTQDMNRLFKIALASLEPHNETYSYIAESRRQLPAKNVKDIFLSMQVAYIY